jgi:hypothetical protein
MPKFYKASKNEIPELPEPKVEVVAPKPLTIQKRQRLMYLTTFALEVLAAAGTIIEKGITKVTGFEGFTFKSSKTVIDEKRGLLVEVFFHPLREEAITDAQRAPVAKFFFQGRSYNEKSWRVVNFVDHDSWQRELETLIPKAKQLIEAAKNRRTEGGILESRRAEASATLKTEAPLRGAEWRGSLEANTQEFLNARHGPKLVKDSRSA